MKITCPKCQFENQADSVRVVCGRCATIIEVRIEQSIDVDAEGNRRTAGLPLSNSRFDNKPEASNLFQATAGQSANDLRTYGSGGSIIEDTFDNVLELPSNPRTPTGFQESAASGFDSPTVFDDVLSTSGYDLPDDFKSSTGDRRSAMPMDNYPNDVHRDDAHRGGGGQDSFPPRDQEFMGWPVLPDSSAIDDEEGETGQLSSGGGGVIGRILVAALLASVLIFGGYYFFGGYFKKKNTPDVAETAKADTSQNSSANANSNNTTDEIAGLGETQKPVSIPPTDPPPSAAQNQVVESQQPALPTVAAAPASDNKYTLQVASLTDQQQANDKINQFKAKGYEARVVKAEVDGKGTRYRIYVGGFSDKNLAKKFGEEMVKKTNGLVSDYLITVK